MIAPLDITLTSPALPSRDLRVLRLTLREAISRPYQLDLDLVLLDAEEGMDLDAAIGADVNLLITRDGEELRRVHGILTEIDDLADPETDYRTYRARIAPRASRLALLAVPETFLAVSVPELVAQKLLAVGLDPTDIEMRLTAQYPPRDIVIQYRETDLALVSRLTEHEGISVFFEQRDDRDVVILTDTNYGFLDLGAAPFRPRGEKRSVYRLEVKRRARPALYAVRDYNDQLPTVDLTGIAPITGGLAGGVIEHGAHHPDPVQANRLARVRAEQTATETLVYTGESALPGLTAGGLLCVEGHPRLGTVDLLLTDVEHRTVQSVAGHVREGDSPHYTNTFHAVPAAQPYRPPRVTPRPSIAGLVHGVIVPPPGGDPSFAQVDEQGRYTVRFLFDISGDETRPASIPIRMAQPHAGAGYGMHLPLKPGTEVVIAFIDGDPDRPIIVGAVPNPITPSPVDSSGPYAHRIRTQTGIVFELVDGR